ncbi:MAG: GNAT family N-acetyltransferase [Gammaproteobacteria bacterium]|nr:GNAT family N-acetyltransferase [Gammaproteobacteria bacterium]
MILKLAFLRAYQMNDPLNNPVWHALETKQRQMAISHGGASRYPSCVSTFAAIRQPNDACLDDLSNIVARGESVGILHTGSMPEHGAFVVRQERRAYQMLCPEYVHGPDETPEVLSLADAEPAVDLAALTKPGPFGGRTIQMGTYVGFRDGQSLVAFGGERFSFPGFTEVSAVCTHPDYRGRRYAESVVRWLCGLIQEKGEVPFLHVVIGSPSEQAAVGLYERVGFSIRRTMEYALLERTCD